MTSPIGSERDLISDAILAERRERRLRIVLAVTPDFLATVDNLPAEKIPPIVVAYRDLVDALESIAEPTEPAQ